MNRKLEIIFFLLQVGNAKGKVMLVSSAYYNSENKIPGFIRTPFPYCTPAGIEDQIHNS